MADNDDKTPCWCQKCKGKETTRRSERNHRSKPRASGAPIGEIREEAPSFGRWLKNKIEKKRRIPYDQASESDEDSPSTDLATDSDDGAPAQQPRKRIRRNTPTLTVVVVLLSSHALANFFPSRTIRTTIMERRRVTRHALPIFQW